MDETPASKPARPSSSRRRRRLKWLMYLAFLALTVLICHFGWGVANRELIHRQSEREWAGTRAAVDQADPDWTWERLNAKRPRPPEGKNGADLIPRIKKLTHRDWGKTFNSPEWKSRTETAPPNVRYSPELVALVRADATASAEAVNLAQKLKDYPSGHREIHLKPDVISTPLEDTQHTRHAAELLRWDVVIAVEENDRARAVENLRAMLNASRSIGDEPFLISQLVRMAVRTTTVRSTEWLLAQTTDATGLEELQAALAADAEEPLLLYGVRGDRAAFDTLFANLDSGETTPDQAIDSGFTDLRARFGWWHYRAYLPADRAFALQWMTSYADAAKLPIHEQPPAVAAIPDPVKDPTRLLSGALLVAVDRVANAHWRATAEARCAVVGIASERFRQQHGRWPHDLAELTRAFLPAVPLDPFDGQPLRLKQMDDGVLVYSVGKRPPNQFGLQPPPPRPELPEGVEFGFRLWNPDRRRLPPPPEPAPAPHEVGQP